MMIDLWRALEYILNIKISNIVIIFYLIVNILSEAARLRQVHALQYPRYLSSRISLNEFQKQIRVKTHI